MASFQRLRETHAPTVGIMVTPPTGDAEWFFPVRVAVREGALKYSLSAIVNIDSLTRVVPGQFPEEWTRSILDPQGRIAVRTRGAENFVGQRAPEAFLQRLDRSPETISRETTLDGAAVYAATSRNTHHWTWSSCRTRSSTQRCGTRWRRSSPAAPC
jgi:hypothetical protein